MPGGETGRGVFLDGGRLPRGDKGGAADNLNIIIKAVNNNGAVSPEIRATANSTPVKIPALTALIRINKATFQRGAPSANAASRKLIGTKASILSVVRTTTGIAIKEIKMTPTIDDHDYDVKMKAIHKFLAEGDRVKISLRFRGREMANQALGMKLMDRVQADTTVDAKVEQSAKFEGRQMIMVIAPK
mgnify:CR=1 FL=1